jgi:hypothetical protein
MSTNPDIGKHTKSEKSAFSYRPLTLISIGWVIHISTRYMLQNSRVCFFLRSPKRRRQLRHRRTGLGDPETGKIGRKSVKKVDVE